MLNENISSGFTSHQKSKLGMIRKGIESETKITSPLCVAMVHPYLKTMCVALPSSIEKDVVNWKRFKKELSDG